MQTLSRPSDLIIFCFFCVIRRFKRHLAAIHIVLATNNHIIEHKSQKNVPVFFKSLGRD